MIKTNISTWWNNSMIDTTLHSLKENLQNANWNKKQILEFLIEILQNENSRVNYVNIKSIIIIYSMLDIFENTFENIWISWIEELLTNMNNSFLEEDLEIYENLENEIINIILKNNINYNINNKFILILKSKIKQLLSDIAINLEWIEWNKKITKEEIKKFLKQKLKSEIRELMKEVSEKINLIIK